MTTIAHSGGTGILAHLPSSRGRIAALAGRNALVAAAYLAATLLGAAFAHADGVTNPIWHPAGFAVAALLLGGLTLWPGLFAGALLGGLATGAGLLVSLPTAAAATASGLVSVALLRRARFRPQLDRLKDAALLVAAACLAAAIGAAIGVGGMTLAGRLQQSGIGPGWLAWAGGDAASVLVVGSLLLTWLAPSADDALREHRAEAAFALACVMGTAIVLFFDVFDLRAHGEAVAFPIIPLLVWVAFRVGPRGTALASFIFSILAVAATQRGLGPFVGATLQASQFYLVVFVGLTAGSAAAVAAVVAERETAERGLRSAVVTARRALADMQAVEGIGRRLAEAGPTPDSLDAVVGLLVDVVGFDYAAVYLGDDRQVRLGAQRGHDRGDATVERGGGLVGRALETRRPVYVRDARIESGVARVDPAIRSVLCAPLLHDDELLGVVRVEISRTLEERDQASINVVADRIAASLALARERGALAERAATFRRLLGYSERIGGSLDAGELPRICVEALDPVVPADLVTLVALDATRGEYVVRAATGSGGSVGQAVPVGEGPAGLAIRQRRLVRQGPGEPASASADAERPDGADTYAHVVGLPLLHEKAVIGALTAARVDPAAPFSDLELEALQVIADEVALVLTNAQLHAEMADLAIHDPLTGLHNRRYFDAALHQVLATRHRAHPEQRQPLAAVLFDLDHFGDFNLQHGHQIGDAVLRTFGAILQGRLREADLVARYGGEEFIAILSGASLQEAVQVADTIRLTLAEASVPGVDGSPLRVTVSAGCAAVGDEDRSGEELIRTADIGLVAAKRAGRNTVVAA
jgi:diguanylate cyclase (GGDEF)-like protein